MKANTLLRYVDDKDLDRARQIHRWWWRYERDNAPRPVLYLAGPYTGDEKLNIRRARDFHQAFLRGGFLAFCPHTHTAHYPVLGAADYKRYIELGMTMMYFCTHLVLLPMWEHSIGAITELMVADRWGIKIEGVEDYASGSIGKYMAKPIKRWGVSFPWKTKT